MILQLNSFQWWLFNRKELNQFQIFSTSQVTLARVFSFSSCVELVEPFFLFVTSRGNHVGGTIRRFSLASPGAVLALCYD